MSHGSGIKLPSTLALQFTNSTDRALLISIVEESFHISQVVAKKGTFLEDLDTLEVTLPCYILVQTDEQTWVFFAYIPDTCTVREKMLFASSKSSFLKELGYNFLHVIQASTKHEITSKGYKDYLAHVALEAPMTSEEKEKKLILSESARLDTSINARSNLISGVNYPIDLNILEQLKSSNWTVLAINNEVVQIVNESTFEASFPSTEPRYGVYKKDGETYFIYVCPRTSKVKDRMIYSSAKASIGLHIESILGTLKKLELETIEEMTDFMTVAQPEKKKLFSKPLRPGKGEARIV